MDTSRSNVHCPLSMDNGRLTTERLKCGGSARTSGANAMTRRRLLALAAVAAMVLIAAMAQKKEDELLLLQWAKKAKLPTPPVAILIEMGVKDTEPSPWSGKATVTGARVVHREGYRFRPDDKLIEP